MEHPLEDAVEVAGDLRHLGSDVVDQPGALHRDRLTDLGGLGDPLDQLLGLVAGEQPLPDAVDHLAVDHLVERPLHGLALQRLGDRPLGGRALERAQDRGRRGLLERGFEPGRLGDPAGTSCARADKASQQRWAAGPGPARRRAFVSHPAAKIGPAQDASGFG